MLLCHGSNPNDESASNRVTFFMHQSLSHYVCCEMIRESLLVIKLNWYFWNVVICCLDCKSLMTQKAALLHCRRMAKNGFEAVIMKRNSHQEQRWALLLMNASQLSYTISLMMEKFTSDIELVWRWRQAFNSSELLDNTKLNAIHLFQKFHFMASSSYAGIRIFFCKIGANFASFMTGFWAILGLIFDIFGGNIWPPFMALDMKN